MIPLARLPEVYKTLLLVSLLPTNYHEPFLIFSKNAIVEWDVCAGLLLPKIERYDVMCVPAFVFPQNVRGCQRMCTLCVDFFQTFGKHNSCGSRVLWKQNTDASVG